MLEVCNSLADVVVVDNALFGAEKRRTTCSLLWQAVSQIESTVMLGVFWPESAPFLVAKWDLVYGDRGALLQKKNIVVDARGVALLSSLLAALSIWDTELTVLGVL